MHRRVPTVALSLAALGALGLIGAGAASQSPPEGPAAQKTAAAVQPPALDTARWPEKPWPPGMVWVPAGEFTMGTDDEAAMPNERPAHRVKLDGFWMDEHDVTNAEYRKFVEATGYVTTAEKPIDWEEIKKQVPPGTPKPPEENLKPGSIVFTPPRQAVDLRD